MFGRTAHVALLLLALLPALACESAPLAQPRVEWVRADRATFDAIGQRFGRYVLEDPAYRVREDGTVQDPDGRAIWLAALLDWQRRLEAAELALGLVPAPPAGEVPR